MRYLTVIVLFVSIIGLLAGPMLANIPHAHAVPHYTNHMVYVPNDPSISKQWALQTIQALDAWNITMGSPIIIAVVDTGVAAEHPDLAANVLPGYNAIQDNDNTYDDHGHGTAIAGLIAARADNSIGVAGICPDCAILPVKVLDAYGVGEDRHLARGIRWATDNGAQVINLSLGGAEESHILQEAIEYASQKGVLIVASSGNDHQLGNFRNYPAAYPQVVGVGATDPSDMITDFSNTGEYVDLAAPGVDLWTTTRDGAYGQPNGTSFSSAFVAGVAGLVLTLRSDVSNADVACILKASTNDMGEPGKDSSYGWGRLNALQAVHMALHYTICPLTYTTAATEHYQQIPAMPMPNTASAFASVPPVPETSNQAYFPETGHVLRGAFYRYWWQHGGLPLFGYPISEAFMTRGSDGHMYVVQYFERYRFELHPEHDPPYHVQIGLMGDDVLRLQGHTWFTLPDATTDPGCMFFEQTGHTLCGTFREYWQTHGLEFNGQAGTSFEESLALFGLPLSEPQVEEVAPGVHVMVQWFERARFEDHGEQGVLLGLLGRESAHMQGWQ